MSAKHTPAPWEVVGSNGTVGVGLRIFAGTRFIGFVGNSDEEAKQCSANAHLIAAAPESYAANRAVMDAIDGHTEWSPHPDVDTDDWNEDAHIQITLTVRDCRMLKAAITKAEGRVE